MESIGFNSEQNREDIQAFFPMVIIVVNDGYFMRLATQSYQPLYGVEIKESPFIGQPPLYMSDTTPLYNQNQWLYKFTQKIPFARITEVPTPVYGHDSTFDDYIIENGYIPAGILIADTLSGTHIITYNSSMSVPQGNRFSVSFIDQTKAAPLKGGAHYPPYIAKELLNAMNYSMTWNAPMTSQFKTSGGFSIPEEIVDNFTSENVTFIGPMVIAILDGFDWIGTSEMSFWSMSNTQIVDAPQVFVYIRPGTGVVYSLCNPELSDGGRSHMLSQGLYEHWGLFNLLQIFSTQEAAAAMGAMPDLKVVQWCF